MNQRFALLLLIIVAATAVAARFNHRAAIQQQPAQIFRNALIERFGRLKMRESGNDDAQNNNQRFLPDFNVPHVPGVLIVGVKPSETDAGRCPDQLNVQRLNPPTAQLSQFFGRGLFANPPATSKKATENDFAAPVSEPVMPVPVMTPHQSPSDKKNVLWSPLPPTALRQSATLTVPGVGLIPVSITPISHNPMPLPDAGCLYTITAPAAIERLLSRALTKNDWVTTVDPDYLYQTGNIPNDPLFNQQWGLQDINAPEAWDIATAAPITVAVLDSGVDVRHPDLRKNILINQKEIPGNGLDDDRNGYRDDYYGWDFIAGNGEPTDDQGHGTHVAGIIGAGGNNGLGVTGIAWQKIKILPVKVADANGKGDLIALLRGLLYAVSRGARLINASLSSDGPANTLYAALREAGKKGVTLVAIAGNNNRDTDRQPAYPGAFDLSNIITVAATDERDERAISDTDPRVGSNFGPVSVDLGAPGHNILSTIPGGYGMKSGTSQAAPMVTGALTLAMGIAGDALNYRDLKTILLASVDRIPSMEETVSRGRLNLKKFLQAVQRRLYLRVIKTEIRTPHSQL